MAYDMSVLQLLLPVFLKSAALYIFFCVVKEHYFDTINGTK
jgi:hypothetical protein